MVREDDAAHAQAFTYTLTGKLASVTDAAGERVFAYNEYDELMTDSLTADEVTHVITENRDEYGRGIGYGYAKDNNVQQSVSYGYGTDGRLCSAGFTHSGESKQFGFSYLSGSNMLQTLTMPNGMTLTQQYEPQRNLLTAMLYKRGETSVVERFYTYDTLGRPLTRTENRQGGSRSDSFTHNDRSELTAATLGTANYAYAYDNIGNRKSAQENAEEATNYDANKAGDGVSPISRTAGAPGGRGRVRRDRGTLNQYTAVGSFTPEFDADGNQTKVQTSTGIWNVTYNAENRPVIFTRENEDGTQTRVTCAYDYMGRRATKKVETITTNAEKEVSTASTTLNQRYLYRGYLQVACCDLTRSDHPCLWLITWDPTQPVATRPLAIQKDATWYIYGWDLTKNVCEVFSKEGYISNTVVYRYTPYGAVTASGTVTQPIQWSSEFYDDELGLVYYNYRNYNTSEGRWLRMDPIGIRGGNNSYKLCMNQPISRIDVLGRAPNVNLLPRDGSDVRNSNGKSSYELAEICVNFSEFTVIGHGNEEGTTIGGHSAESLFNLMKQKGYTACKNIRLIACRSGRDSENGIAKKLQEAARQFCCDAGGDGSVKVYAFFYNTQLNFDEANRNLTTTIAEPVQAPEISVEVDINGEVSIDVNDFPNDVVFE